MKNKKVVLYTLVLLIISFMATALFYQKSLDTKTEKLATNKNEIPFVREHSPSFGKNKMNITIVEFVDPECEACSAFHPAVKKVFEEYKDETRLVYRYLDNHSNSRFAIRLLEAARVQNKYKEALDIIFKYQAKWAPHNAPKPDLLWTFLPEAGLDMKKLKKDFDNNNINNMVNLDRVDSATLGVRGTPTIFVNGKKLKSLRYKTLLDLVESEIYK